MTIKINNDAIMTDVFGRHTFPNCKPVINKTTGEIYASALDAAEALNVHHTAVSHACRGTMKTCKGFRLEYLDKTSGNVDSLASEIRRLRAENERLKADASIGRAIREAQEAQQKEVDNAQLVLEKAKAKFERCEAMVIRKETEYQNAIDRYSAAETELHEAELNLLKAKGEIK